MLDNTDLAVLDVRQYTVTKIAVTGRGVGSCPVSGSKHPRFRVPTNPKSQVESFHTGPGVDHTSDHQVTSLTKKVFVSVSRRWCFPFLPTWRVWTTVGHIHILLAASPPRIFG